MDREQKNAGNYFFVGDDNAKPIKPVVKPSAKAADKPAAKPADTADKE
jgi:hypothetical protein